jgi:hypothetical protein
VGFGPELATIGPFAVRGHGAAYPCLDIALAWCLPRETRREAKKRLRSRVVAAATFVF